MKKPVPKSWFLALPYRTRKRITRLLGPNTQQMLNGALADGSDGCTLAPDIGIGACWLHDALLNLGYTWEADRQFFLCIWDLGRSDPWFWRIVWWLPLACVYYAGVTIGQVWRRFVS